MYPQIGLDHRGFEHERVMFPVRTIFPGPDVYVLNRTFL